MAIEVTDDLVELQKRTLEEAAKAGPYSVEAWAPWLKAAQALEVAVTEHARATKQNRLDVAMAVRKAAREASARSKAGGSGG